LASNNWRIGLNKVEIPQQESLALILVDMDVIAEDEKSKPYCRPRGGAPKEPFNP